MLVLAAGGDPHRELDLDSVAAERLADELDSPERREALHAALAALDDRRPARPSPRRSPRSLSEPELAWRCFALALLADELAEE